MYKIIAGQIVTFTETDVQADFFKTCESIKHSPKEATLAELKQNGVVSITDSDSVVREVVVGLQSSSKIS